MNLFFVIIAVSVTPLYIFVFSDRKNRRKHEKDLLVHESERRKHDGEKHDKYIEREREIIAVVKENSAAIAGLTTVTAGLKYYLETNSADTKLALGRIHERIDTVLADTAQIKAALSIKDPGG